MTRKQAPRYSSGKCVLKPHGDTILYPLQWLEFKRRAPLDVSEERSNWDSRPAGGEAECFLPVENTVVTS